MGDLIEFASWPNHQNIFYKITSSAVAFSVKGERYAAVGLATKPCPRCEYWIIIGHNKCWFERDTLRSNTNRQVNILSNQHFTKFWISWHSSEIQFGKTSDGIPMITEKIDLYDIKYVTFSVYGERGHLSWKLYLPPKLERPISKKVKGDMEWIEGDNVLPYGALIGGFDNEILYIIRAKHQGSLTPGKFVPSLGLGFISWGGEAHEKSDFEVLCGHNCIWVPTCSNRIPAGAVVGGYSENTNETLYVGRALQQGHLVPGKVQPSHSVCYIPYNDREIAKKEYEILVNPQITRDSPNCYVIDKIGLTGHDSDEDNSNINVSWEHDDSGSEEAYVL